MAWQARLGVCILLYSIFGCNAESPRQCTEAGVDACMKPLRDQEKQYGAVDDAVVIYNNEKQIRAICDVFNTTTEPCLLELTPSCPFLVKKRYDGKLAAYNYVCDLTMEHYLRFQPCLNNTELQTEAHECWKTYNEGLKEIDQLFKDDATLPKYAQKLCLYVNKFLDCVYEIVKSECGTTVAHWNRVLDERSVRPYVCAFGCSITESDVIDCKGYRRLYTSKSANKDDSWEFIVIGVAVAVVVITFLTIGLLVYILCVRPKQVPNTQPRQSGDPPPGTVVMYHKGGKTVIPPEAQEMADYAMEMEKGEEGEYVNPGYAGNIEEGQAPNAYEQFKQPALHRDEMWQAE